MLVEIFSQQEEKAGWCCRWQVETGDIIPCDGLLVEAVDVNVDESHLTGESDTVFKEVHDNPIMYSGSKVKSGYGRMIVTQVGERSVSGRLSALVNGG